MLCSLCFYLYADPLAENQARFGAVSGDVGLLSQGAPEWIEAHEGLPIEPGDQIRTGEDGRVELVLSDAALWMLEPETMIAVERMDAQSGRFHLSSGTLMGKVDSAQVAGTPQRWEFNTPVAVVAVRGTEFAINVSKEEGTRLGVFEGEVDLQPAEGPEGLPPPIRIQAGYEGFVRRGRPLETLSVFSPRMQRMAMRQAHLRRRQRHFSRTWSPFTPAYRQELRRRLVAPPPKPKPFRPRARPSRRASPRRH